jgi:alkylation response protein AidB-like acyl-CoA dehydrogenase
MPEHEAIEHLDYDLLRKLLRKAGDLGLLGIDIPETPGQKGPKNPVQDVLFVSFIIQ